MRHSLRAKVVLRNLHRAGSSCALLGILGLLSGCGSSSDDPATSGGNVLIKDENNYSSTSSLTIPTIQTAPATDLQICWSGVSKDLQKHTIDPQAVIANVALLRFLNLSQAAVAEKIDSSNLTSADVDDYKDFHTDKTSTCANLSALSFLTNTPINLSTDYSEAADRTYLMILSSSTTPGVGASTMSFLQPTAASTNTQVDIPSAESMLTFNATFSTVPVQVPAGGPWVVDWGQITHDSQMNAVPFAQIDSLLLGFYAGKTLSELQSQALDLKLVDDASWAAPLNSDSTTANLAGAHNRRDNSPFPGFTMSQTGTWLLALECSTCTNPAPIVVASLEPTG